MIRVQMAEEPDRRGQSETRLYYGRVGEPMHWVTLPAGSALVQRLSTLSEAQLRTVVESMVGEESGWR